MTSSFCYEFLFRRVSVPTTAIQFHGFHRAEEGSCGQVLLPLSCAHVVCSAPDGGKCSTTAGAKAAPTNRFVAPGRSPGAGSPPRINHSNCRQLVIKCHQILRMSSNVFYECTWPPQCIHNWSDSSKSALDGRTIETRSEPNAPCITTE